MIDALLFVLVIGAVTLGGRGRCRCGDHMAAEAFWGTAMKHPRQPTPTPPPEMIDTGMPPGIPLDELGAPDLRELVLRWGGYDQINAATWKAFDEAQRRWHEQRRDKLTR